MTAFRHFYLLEYLYTSIILKKPKTTQRIIFDKEVLLDVYQLKTTMKFLLSAPSEYSEIKLYEMIVPVVELDIDTVKL